MTTHYYIHIITHMHKWLTIRAGKQSGPPNGFINRLTMVWIGALIFAETSG